MDKTKKQMLLDAIGWLYEKSEGSQLNQNYFDQAQGHMELLAAYLQVSPMQAFLMAVVFSLDINGGSVDQKDLSRHFGCNPIKVLSLSDDLEVLCQRNILIKEQHRSRRGMARAGFQYTINAAVIDAILRNMPMPQTEEVALNDVIDVFERVCELNVKKNDDLLSTDELFSRTIELLEANQSFPVVQKITKLGLGGADTYILCYIIWRTVTGHEFTHIDSTLNGMFDQPSRKARYVQSLIKGVNPLFDMHLFELTDASFFNDAGIKLTKKALEMLEDDSLKLTTGKRSSEGLTDPVSITARQLIYNPDEERQLQLIKKLLDRQHFRQTQQRLEEKGLPHGVAVLLHGGPGTGKTETVLQIARETGREIMRVDISHTKSMWFGESEKIIKRMFTNYNDIAAESTHMPILLINEADAIISKRREIGSSSVSQTENTIQNIILEELENFRGILFATTNLVKNLDTAFERRFLFKVEMKKPCLAARAHIWKLKLPALSDLACEQLAAQFDFSGGQIDNIARKQAIHEVVHDTSPDFSHIMAYCQAELLEKSSISRIGYVL